MSSPIFARTLWRPSGVQKLLLFWPVPFAAEDTIKDFSNEASSRYKKSFCSEIEILICIIK